ncbi:MAG TPA: VOC family protein [Amycolatopsis sp.]|jgi:hypothetical protein|nr:VOC family protein [Amycolatopsis sp.]
MTTGPTTLEIDAVHARDLARFWAALLDWPLAPENPAVVRPPPEDGCEFDLAFVLERRPKQGKNRLHLDLASRTDDHQQALVARALRLGARHLDIGQGDVRWVVLEDPEHNEFCVLEPRPAYTRAGALAALVVDAQDPTSLADFWSTHTGWPIAQRQPAIVTLRAPSGRGPAIEFLRSTEPGPGRNRLRLDLAEHSGPDPEGNEFA